MYNFIEVFLVKDKSKRDISLMLKKTSCMTAYDSVHGNMHIMRSPASYKNILEISIDVFSPVSIK